MELTIPTPTKNAFHNDTLTKYSELLYKNIFTVGNIVSKEQMYAFKQSNALSGFRLEKSNERRVYFIKTKDIDQLPIKIINTKKDVFRTDVLYIITEAESVKIPSSKEASFRNIVDWMCNFDHTNPTHWKLYKIMCIASAIDRVNFRVVGDAGFGKDSIVDAIAELINETANIYGATFAKLEYHLKNKFLFFNEMGNLNKDDKFNMQQFFLQAGAYRNKYIKKSRKSEGTKEEYDMIRTSVCVAGNPYSYYKEKGQETFIDMFTTAVIDRFIPFRLDGVLTQDFSEQFDVENVVQKNKTFYMKIISTLNWYRDNYNLVQAVDWGYKPELDLKVRYERSFNVISKYISLYAKDKEEYKELVDALVKSYHQARIEETEYSGHKIRDFDTKKVEIEDYGG